jgi:hypothetical protein
MKERTMKKKKNYVSVKCTDGFSMSVQANMNAYCEPKTDEGPYTDVEVGYPSQPDLLLQPYAEEQGNWTDTIYGYVPVHVVQMVIDAHGGMTGGELPPFKFDPSLNGMFSRKDYVGE